jgi:hypothetical protein
MIRVTVDKLKTGQVLAQDVLRDDGVILMTKGRALTEEAIALLGRLEVESVVLEGDLFASEEERQAYVRKQEEALDERFSRVTDDQVLMAVREMFRKRLKKGCSASPPQAPPPAEPPPE